MRHDFSRVRAPAPRRPKSLPFGAQSFGGTPRRDPSQRSDPLESLLVASVNQHRHWIDSPAAAAAETPDRGDE